MRKQSLFEIPVYIERAKKHQLISDYMTKEILPVYLKQLKKQNNKTDDFKHGAELGGAYSHLSTIGHENTNKNDDTLETVYSDYFPGAPEVDNQLLHDLYLPNIKTLMNRLKFSKDVDWNINGYYWYNITERGGSQDTHDHIMGPTCNTICGIHYIEFDEKELSPAFFINPQEQLMRPTYPSKDTKMVPESFKNLISAPSVKEGEIVWFPPWLKHTVAKQMSDKRRITMAMDITITHE